MEILKEKIKIKFIGINKWGNPVFKEIKRKDKKRRYWGIPEVYNYNTTLNEILEKEAEREGSEELKKTLLLTYFGKSADCEITGGTYAIASLV